MKKSIYIILILIMILVAVFYFLNYNKKSADISYQEPTPGFFDKGLVKEGDIVIKITPNGFVPATITIKKGQKVTWVNETKNYVWPASNPHPTHTDYSSGFDPELPMKEGQAWSFTFDKIGNWGYHDHLDPTTRGTLKVIE